MNLNFLLRRQPFFFVLFLVAFAPSTVRAGIAFTGGHGDIGVAYDGPGQLHVHWHTHSNAIIGGVLTGADNEYDADQLYAVIPRIEDTGSGGTVFTIPGGGAWNFTGANPGDEIYFKPETEMTGVPFLGIAAEELDGAQFTGSLDWTFSLVSGPGQFSIWQGFGPPTPYVSSADGDNSFSQVSFGGHDHFSFGFTQPGIYLVEVTASATHITDGLATGSGVFEFQVNAVPEPSTFALLTLAGIPIARMVSKRQRKSSDGARVSEIV
jgi:surface-anchored protein